MKIVVFTGAGVSRESGLLTFRDSEDGLWNGYDVMKVASIQGWWSDPKAVLDFYNWRRREVLEAEPNEAHRLIAQLDDRHDVTVITQNVDDLHERAGSRKIIHLHGELLKARPVDSDDGVVEWRGDIHLGDVDALGRQMRPHIVWFGEGLPMMDEALKIALSPDVDVLIVCGTSLNVYPAALIATETTARQVYLIDPEPPELAVRNLTCFACAASEGMAQVVTRLGY